MRLVPEGGAGIPDAGTGQKNDRQAAHGGLTLDLLQQGFVADHPRNQQDGMAGGHGVPGAQPEGPPLGRGNKGVRCGHGVKEADLADHPVEGQEPALEEHQLAVLVHILHHIGVMGGHIIVQVQGIGVVHRPVPGRKVGGRQHAQVFVVTLDHAAGAGLLQPDLPQSLQVGRQGQIVLDGLGAQGGQLQAGDGRVGVGKPAFPLLHVGQVQDFFIRNRHGNFSFPWWGGIQKGKPSSGIFMARL